MKVLKMMGKSYCSVKSYIRGYYFSMKFNMASWDYPFRDLKYGIGNLFSYFMIIWNDRDWDSHYWLVLNEKKLDRMEKLIRNHGNHLYHIRDADNIRHTRLAIKRIIADDYHENVYRHHDKKWGKSDFVFHPLNDGSDCSELKITHENAVTDEEKEQQTIEYGRLINKSDYLKRQDMEYVTMMLNKYLFHWWD